MNAYVEFSSRLGGLLLESLPNCHGSDNWDPYRFGRRPLSLKRRLFEITRRAARIFLEPAGVRLIKVSDAAQRYRSFMERYGEGVAHLYQMLADEHSRQMLVEVMAYRLLGYEHVKLSTASKHFEYRKRAEALANDDDCIDIGFMGWNVVRFDLSAIGCPALVYSTPGSISGLFLCPNYVYARTSPAIGPVPGDYVIDGGAAWGDTAIAFAWQVGETGRVFSFEFEPTNLQIMGRNLELNPDLRKRIELVPKALWNKSGSGLSFSSNGPGTSVSGDGNGSTSGMVSTVALDDFCKELPRVDFIKMDIEGAELQALQGAVTTLERHKPKLAICLYHRLDDFVTIPRFLSGLNLDYQYFLQHCTIHQEETILFASPRSAGES